MLRTVITLLLLTMAISSSTALAEITTSEQEFVEKKVVRCLERRPKAKKCMEKCGKDYDEWVRNNSSVVHRWELVLSILNDEQCNPTQLSPQCEEWLKVLESIWTDYGLGDAADRAQQCWNNCYERYC